MKSGALVSPPNLYPPWILVCKSVTRMTEVETPKNLDAHLLENDFLDISNRTPNPAKTYLKLHFKPGSLTRIGKPDRWVLN